MSNQIKKYRIKDKSGNTKDVIYNPSCGLSAQEFLSVEIAKFNAEKENLAKNDAKNQDLDEKKENIVSSSPAGSEEELPDEEKKVVPKKEQPSPKKEEKEKPLAYYLAAKSGVKLSSIAAKRVSDSKKMGKKPSGVSISSYIPKDRLVSNNVKKD